MNTARRAIRDFAVRSAEATGLFAALRWLQRDQVTILCYHSVVDTTLPRWVAYGGLHLSVADFQRHVRYLARHYTVLTVGRIAEAIRGGESIPRRTLALTFDDGYANNTVNVAPILRAAGIRATLFLATDYIDQPDLFWWDELGLILAAARRDRYESGEPWGVVDLRSDGGAVQVVMRARALLDGATRTERQALLDRLATFLEVKTLRSPFYEELRPAKWSELRAAADVFEYGAHTAGHRVLDLLKNNEAVEEITRCRKQLEQRLNGSVVPAFSYPAGRHNDSVVQAVRSADYNIAVTTEPGRLVRAKLGKADRWRLPRIPVTTGTSSPLLAALIAGMPRFGRETR